MKREIIDASQLELNEKVVSIKRVTKVVKGGRDVYKIQESDREHRVELTESRRE